MCRSDVWMSVLCGDVCGLAQTDFEGRGLALGGGTGHGCDGLWACTLAVVVVRGYKVIHATRFPALVEIDCGLPRGPEKAGSGGL